MLIAIRLVAGGMQANISVASAYVADITPPEDRAKRFGLLGAMFGVGFILGPVLGGIPGVDQPASAVRCRRRSCHAESPVRHLTCLPESLPTERRRSFSWAAANPFGALRRLTDLKGVAPLAVVVACSGLAQFMLYTCWVLYNTFKFGWGPRENGWSLAAVGVVSAIVQGVLLGRLLKVVSVKRLAVFGSVVLDAGLCVMGRRDPGLDDVRGHRRRTCWGTRSHRLFKASFRAQRMRRIKGRRWVRSAALTA